MYHNCYIYDEDGIKLYDRDLSLKMLNARRSMYKGEGWRMLGVMKKCLQDNNINLHKKIAEWNKRARQ